MWQLNFDSNSSGQFSAQTGKVINFSAELEYYDDDHMTSGTTTCGICYDERDDVRHISALVEKSLLRIRGLPQ